MRLPKTLTHRSRLFPVWLWHSLFDGGLCPCAHSAEYKRYIKMQNTES